jgi:chromosome segregation ATPase
MIIMTDSQKLDLILEKVIGLEEKITSMDARLSNLEEKVTSMDARLANVENEVTSLREEVTSMDNRLSNVENDVTKMKLVLENEIRVNIQRVAEGHLDLSRNLHDAMKPSSEMEMLSIKVRWLESEVKELKSMIKIC